MATFNPDILILSKFISNYYKINTRKKGKNAIMLHKQITILKQNQRPSIKVGKQLKIKKFKTRRGVLK